MNEAEFYKRKIFDKITINQLKKDFPHLILEINSWYCSAKYRIIQMNKAALVKKLKQISDEEQVLPFSSETLFSFFEWYENIPKVCYYCSLPENVLEELHSRPGHINKRYPKRGKSLEIDRKESNLPYSEINNLVLACYWCNNAKTDTFTETEFLKVGIVIKEIWQKRLNSLF